jgi:hypothetical protein
VAIERALQKKFSFNKERSGALANNAAQALRMAGRTAIYRL